MADQIELVAKIAGHDHVGVGSDFDGIGNALPEGLGNVSTYPVLLTELMRSGWSDADRRKLPGENELRVMEQAERLTTSMRDELPHTDVIGPSRRPS